MTKVDPDDIKLEHIFNIVEIESPYLCRLTKEVLSIISTTTDIYEMGFDAIREGRTYSGEAGEVTEDGDIILDSGQLKKYEDDVAMTLVAHEFAHYYLDHYLAKPYTLEQEAEADEQARKWGFNVEKFRKVIGPPTSK